VLVRQGHAWAYRRYVKAERLRLRPPRLILLWSTARVGRPMNEPDTGKVAVTCVLSEDSVAGVVAARYVKVCPSHSLLSQRHLQP
jgi:hypothetical protein